MKYFAAINALGFANSWDVLAFSTKAQRDAFVEKRDGMRFNNNYVDCRAILKKDVSHYAANFCTQHNRVVKPKPFSGQCWILVNFDTGEHGDGYLGHVQVGYPENGARVF